MRKSTMLRLCIFAATTLSGCEKPREVPVRSKQDALGSPLGENTPGRGGSLSVPGNSGDAPTHQVPAPMVVGDARPNAVPTEPGRELTVELRASNGAKLRGRAALREQGDGVEIALEVQKGNPGTLLLALHDTGSCTQATPKDVSTAAVARQGEHMALQPELGALVIDRSGEGNLRVHIPAANLKREEQGSLLGKALAIYPRERSTTEHREGQKTIACAQILAP